MTVRVWLDHGHNPYKAIRWVPRALKENGWTGGQWQAHALDEERKACTQRLAKGEASFARNWLCVSAQSSSEDLAFWLLLYLCQESMIEETDEVLAFVFVTRYLRPFCKGQTRHPDTLGSVAGDPLAGMIYEVFGRLKRGYALQEHEKGGPAYIWRVVRDVKAGPTLVGGIDPEVIEGMQARTPRGRGHWDVAVRREEG